MGFEFFISSFLLALGLAMDACAVSMTNGMKNPNMLIKKVLLIAFLFGSLQGLMPLIGYLFGTLFVNKIAKFIPYISFLILVFIGGKMLIEGIKHKEEENEKPLTFINIFFQAIATSIDALSVGITVCDYRLRNAIVCFIIIAVITFVICIIAVLVGKKFGDKLSDKSEIFGGIILILIGIYFLLRGIL